jgi:hypothetical protein
MNGRVRITLVAIAMFAVFCLCSEIHAQCSSGQCGSEVRAPAPFSPGLTGATAHMTATAETVAGARATPWRVTAEQAAMLAAQGYQRRIEPHTGNEQWVKSLTHSEPLSSAVASYRLGACADGSCGSSHTATGKPDT